MSEEGLEQKYVQQAFDANWVAPLGPNVDGFEQDLKDFVGQDREVVALSSGTAAVHLALLQCGVGPGDEVLVQSFTFCASSHPVKYLGAVPVFVDSEPDTWNMDPSLLESAILDRIRRTGKTPKAIVVVALYGMPYKVDEIKAVADKFGIPLIEDVAEGLGSRYHGRALGTFGKFGVLSFNGNKIITTSGGGALVCEDREAWKETKKYATQYRESYPYYQHEKIGFNYRMSNICAGIGRGQMSVLEQHIAHHRMLAAYYDQAFRAVDGISYHKGPDFASEGSNYWLSTITLDPLLKVKGQEKAYSRMVSGAVGGAAGVVHSNTQLRSDCEPNTNVEALRCALDESGIESRPVWKPMHKQPVYAGAPSYLNGVSEEIFRRGLCLPSGPMVSLEDAARIVDTIKSVLDI